MTEQRVGEPEAGSDESRSCSRCCESLSFGDICRACRYFERLLALEGAARAFRRCSRLYVLEVKARGEDEYADACGALDRLLEAEL